jgi:translation initiation factor 3 subunit D
MAHTRGLQASVKVQADWVLVEDFDLAALTKLQANKPEAEDMYAAAARRRPCANDARVVLALRSKWCGFVDQYDETYDHISTRNPKPLERIENKLFYHVTTTEDPVIEELAVEVCAHCNERAAALHGSACVQATGNVYATDVILAHLMACPRSVYPWDIVVQKVDGNLFFDKRDDSQFDYLTVSETSMEPPHSEDPSERRAG